MQRNFKPIKLVMLTCQCKIPTLNIKQEVGKPCSNILIICICELEG
jgi:hypothetical protein